MLTIPIICGESIWRRVPRILMENGWKCVTKMISFCEDNQICRKKQILFTGSCPKVPIV